MHGIAVCDGRLVWYICQLPSGNREVDYPNHSMRATSAQPDRGLCDPDSSKHRARVERSSAPM
jgi:hypothetical protein